MKCGTWFPSPHQKQGEHRQDSALPTSILLCSRAGAAHPAHRLPAHCVASWFSVWQTRGMLHFQGKCRRSLAPPWAPRSARSPHAGEVLGPGAVQGMEKFSREVPQSPHSPPPRASLQLSLKTEKFVLVFLLLLSSYEMSPNTESLDKFRLLKQHLIQLLSNLHHNIKPLIY